MKGFKKFIAAATTLCPLLTLLAATEASAAETPAKEYELSAENATLHGKYSTKKQGYTFTYGSAGFTVNFTGTEFWIYVPAAPIENEDYRSVGIAVLVDTDMPMEAEMVYIKEPGWIQVASGLSEGEHQITIRKQNRAFYGFMASDWFCVSKFGLSEEGECKSPKAPGNLVIEVYGDSISNGDAVWKNGDTIECYTYGSYTGVLERLLDAEVKVCANSGNGLLGWCLGVPDGKLDNLFPPQNSWAVIDPINDDTQYSHEGANATDVVIINLGTNDRVELANGDMTTEQFHDEYLRFIKQIKEDCPKTIVICTLGAMGAINEFGETIEKVVADANRWNGGKEFCYYIELNECNIISGGLGYDSAHPSNIAHEEYGLQIAEFIKDTLKSESDSEDNDSSDITTDSETDKQSPITANTDKYILLRNIMVFVAILIVGMLAFCVFSGRKKRT